MGTHRIISGLDLKTLKTANTEAIIQASTQLDNWQHWKLKYVKQKQTFVKKAYAKADEARNMDLKLDSTMLETAFERSKEELKTCVSECQKLYKCDRVDL